MQLCFEIDQEMDAILLIIGIVYGICRMVIKSVQQCTYFSFKKYIHVYIYIIVVLNRLKYFVKTRIDIVIQ
jgi:hypothetical protein